MSCLVVDAEQKSSGTLMCKEDLLVKLVSLLSHQGDGECGRLVKQIVNKDFEKCGSVIKQDCCLTLRPSLFHVHLCVLNKHLSFILEFLIFAIKNVIRCCLTLVNRNIS